jgi:cob(I)alamin adenosyltransferase
MGNRLTKIYTRTGDDGTTGMGDGSRVKKDSPRMEAIGTVDELNSTLGVLLTYDLPDTIRAFLITIQHDLFDLGGELSIPGHTIIGPKYTRFLELSLDELNNTLTPLKEFILPGGSRAAAACHHARTVCRRAERRAVTLAGSEEINKEIPVYLNRLSDLLFVTARALARMDGGTEVLWQKDRNR